MFLKPGEYVPVPQTNADGLEEAGITIEPSRPQRLWRRIFAPLVITIAILAIGVLGVPRSSLRDTKMPVLQMIREVPTEQVAFTDSNEWYQNGSRWRDLFPAHDGFILTSPPRDGNSIGEFGCLSVFHSLHCLEALSETIKALRTGDGGHHDEHQHGSGHHLEHCVDYIRQSLMCGGDLSLEPVNIRGQIPNGNLDSVAHSCKNWDRIMEIASYSS